MAFVAGVGFGGLSVMDDMQYKLDKCINTRYDAFTDLNECKGDLKLCEMRISSEGENKCQKK